MAWARPPGAPQLASCPLEALEPRENDYKGLYQIYGVPISFALLGILGPVGSNYYRKRPFYAGIWKHIIGGIALGYLGLKLRDLRQEIADDKDAVLRQYIALHPEDFPPYKRVLIKDTIESWNPRR